MEGARGGNEVGREEGGKGGRAEEGRSKGAGREEVGRRKEGGSEERGRRGDKRKD